MSAPSILLGKCGDWVPHFSPRAQVARSRAWDLERDLWRTGCTRHGGDSRLRLRRQQIASHPGAEDALMTCDLDRGRQHAAVEAREDERVCGGVMRSEAMESA